MPVLDRTQAPSAKPVTQFSLKEAEHFWLDNGVPVCVVNGGSQPIANLQLVFNAGKWHESALGQSYFTGKMLAEGTKQYSNKQISEFFERHGVFWGVSPHADWLEMEFYTLNKHLKSILPVISEILLEATFPENELENLKKISTQNLKVNMEKTSYLASKKFQQELFGEKHPYGYSLDESIIEAMNTDLLKKFYQTAIRENGLQIVLAGQVTNQHIQLLNQTIGQVPFAKIQMEMPQYDIPKAKGGKIYKEQEDALQSSIKIGKTMFVRGDEAQIPFQVANTILGGYFGSRLMKNIREEKGLTYGIYSSLSFLKNSGVWSISADVAKEKKDLALEEIYKEVKVMQEELVSAEVLELVKNYICGSFVKSINSPIPIANCHKAIILHELPNDYYDTYISNIRAVTAQQVQDLMNEHLSDGLLEVVVG